MEQMCKNGYFTKMSDDCRGTYDKKQGEFSKGRKDDDDKWDTMRGDFKTMGATDSMDRKGKQ